MINLYLILLSFKVETLISALTFNQYSMDSTKISKCTFISFPSNKPTKKFYRKIKYHVAKDPPSTSYTFNDTNMYYARWVVRVLAILIVKLHSIVVHSPQIGLWGKLGNARAFEWSIEWTSRVPDFSTFSYIGNRVSIDILCTKSSQSWYILD